MPTSRTGQKTLKVTTHKGRDGSPRVRHLYLTEDAINLIEPHARLRMKTLPLFVNESDRTWQKKHWGEGLRNSVAAARKTVKLPEGIVAYSLGHAALTDWLRAGVNVADVANQGGTSIAMISKTY